MIFLAEMVHGEQQEEQQRQADSKRKYSKRTDTYDAAEEYVEKHDLKGKGYD